MSSSVEMGPEGVDTRTLFRYRMVSAVLSREALGEVRSVAVDAVARESHLADRRYAQQVSRRSLYRWLKAYESHGLEGLMPAPRNPNFPQFPCETLLAFLRERKEADPTVSIPELISRAEDEGLAAQGSLKRTTVWRALKRHDIPTRRSKTVKGGIKRRFAYPHRMQMVLCDGKHFRAGPNRARRVALFFMDDATRFILATVVGPSESSALFLAGVHRCIRQYGLMQRLFLDNGSGFTADESTRAMAALKVHLIHGTVGYPEGRGKVERFNRTIRDDLLRYFDRAEDIEPDCQALARRLRHYIDHVYHRRAHEGLNGATPYDRFHGDDMQLRFPDQGHLRAAFIRTVNRKVSPDLTVPYKGQHYEVPAGYAQQRISLYCDLLDGEVRMMHHGSRITLKPVDLHRNARRLPGKTSVTEEKPVQPLPSGSAQGQFSKDFSPLVDAHGNYHDNKEKAQ